MHFTVRTTWKIRKFMDDVTYEVLLSIKLLEIFDNKIISKVSFFTKLSSMNNLIGWTWNDSYFTLVNLTILQTINCCYSFGGSLTKTRHYLIVASQMALYTWWLLMQLSLWNSVRQEHELEGLYELFPGRGL